MLAYTGTGGHGVGDDVEGPGLEKNKRKMNKKSGARGVASVILHKDATGADTVKSLLALEYFHDELRKAGFDVVGAPPPPLRLPPLSSQSSLPAKKADTNQQQGANRKNPADVNGDGSSGVGVAPGGVVVDGWAKGMATASTARKPVVEAVAGEGTGVGGGAVTAAAVSVPVIAVETQAGVEVGTGAGDPKKGEEKGESRRAGAGVGAAGHQHPSPAELRRCLEAARRRADDGTPGFFAALQALGWSTEKFMFGNIKSRVEWRV